MNEIILDVCRGAKIHPIEFFGPSRERRLGRARKIAIHRLHLAGLSIRAIARIVKRDTSSVEYWLYPHYRQRRREYSQKRHARLAAAA